MDTADMLDATYDAQAAAAQGDSDTGVAGAPDGLWPQDRGTLPFDARAALLQLVRGPYIHETRDAKLWSALLAYREAIASRLSDMFLDLVLNEEEGVAFACNATSEERELPKAARTNTMTLLDSIMVLTLRRELLLSCGNRVFVDQDELFEALAQYRNLDQLDPASYRDRLKTSWNRLVEMRILIKGEDGDRFEVSPVLKIVFGAQEAQAVYDTYQELLESDGVTVNDDEEAADGQ